MTNKINRRQFLQKSLGAAVLGAGIANLSYDHRASGVIDRVKLGETGLMVPRIALGTGSNGGGRASNQTRQGMQSFVRLARHAYDRGLKFYDMADLYGSHQYVKEVLKHVPREESILLTKIWTTQPAWLEKQTPGEMIDRFRKECGTDYFDIVLLHCMMNGRWQEEKKSFVDALSKAKQDGIIKTVGVSCHNWDAMKVAVEDPWVDVILARINPFHNHMDGTPVDVMGLLETASRNGKGVIGMKIFGNGDNTSDEERERSLKFALGSPHIHCMTLGLESISQIDDAVSRVTRLRRA
jgi:1-deoxyxylulose-5-phosphate synthase